MKIPVVFVTLMLATAILLAASLLIVTGTRGEDALWPLKAHPTDGAMPPQPRTATCGDPENRRSHCLA